MIGNRLFGVVTQQPKECQLNEITVVNKLQMTIKKHSSVPLTCTIKYMHKTLKHTFFHCHY